MTTTTGNVLKAVVARRGWKPGTDLENRVALQLSRFGHDPQEVAQQHRAGRYRLDFAWPGKLIALEADGWHHRSPEGAAKDRQRDSWLRAQGWVIFRVDDEHGEDILAEQVMRVCRIVRAEHDDMAKAAERRRAHWPGSERPAGTQKAPPLPVSGPGDP